MSKLHQVIKHGDDLVKVMEAIADGIDVTDIADSLGALGLRVHLNSIKWGEGFGVMVIEGGDDNDWCSLTLQLVKIEVGNDTMNIDHEPAAERTDVVTSKESASNLTRPGDIESDLTHA